MLAFNFASRTFAYKRLAQGVSRSVSALSSFIRKSLEPFVQADQCAQYVDDIGIAANNATDLEDFLVDYHNIFARHRMDIGMNTDFKVKFIPKNHKAVYSQNLRMPIHLKEDLIVELVLMHKYGIITVLAFCKYTGPIFARRKPNGKLRLLVDLRKSTVWLRMTVLTTIIQIALCQTQHNIWQGSH